MLSKLKKSNSEGFTIIEVMIVLAIAGLIILVVLLAVPALQRNGRNTAIKNDASAIAGAVAEFASNNDGAVIGAGSSQTGSTFTVDNTAVTNHQSVTAKVQASTQVNNPRAAGTTAAITYTNAGIIDVTPGVKCGTPSGAGTGAFQPNTRGVAISYPIETPTGYSAKCLDS